MRRSLLILPLILLAACAGQGEFPSLAKRPVETAPVDPPPPPAPPAADAALAKRLDDARATAGAGRAAHEAALAPARVAVQAAGPSGSESWIAAQLELSRLEATLEPARAALSALDAERHSIVSRGNPADLALLEAAIAEIEGIEARQSAAFTNLMEKVSR